MFGIGFFEFILIALAILVFVRPKDLPGFIRKVGLFYRKLMEAYHETMEYIQNISSLDETNSSQQEKTASPEEEGSSATWESIPRGVIKKAKKQKSKKVTKLKTAAASTKTTPRQKPKNIKIVKTINSPKTSRPPKQKALKTNSSKHVVKTAPHRISTPKKPS